jgi:hypothetical protein
VTDARVGPLARLAAEPPRWLVVTLWSLALVAWAISLAVQYVNPVMPGDPWQSQGHLTDFRDSVWTPGRYLLGGGNPYDTATYLQAVPWTQGLALYAPAWLVVGLLLGGLPYLLANAIYQMLGIAMVLVLIRTVVRFTLPRFVTVATPIGLLWLVVWAAGRYALANVSTALVVLGVVLVLRGVWLGRDGSAPPTVVRTATAIGVGLALIKPQFGLVVVVVALAGRRWDAVWRGVAGLAVLSTPIAIACVVASGGPQGFLDGIRSNLARSTSSESAVGLFSPFNVSIDLIGQLGRLGVAPPGWVRVAVPLAALVVAAWIVVRARTLIVLTVGVCCTLLLGFVHQFYDLLVLVLPLCVGIGWIAERCAVSWPDRARWLLASLPTVHVHRVSTNLVPALTTTGADRFDTVVLAAALLLSLGATVRSGRRRRSEQPAAHQREAPPTVAP